MMNTTEPKHAIHYRLKGSIVVQRELFSTEKEARDRVHELNIQGHFANYLGLEVK